MANHLTIGVYSNEQWKYNVVRDEDLDHHIWYNKTFRWGRLLYVDGKRVYDGCHSEEILPKYDKIAEDVYSDLIGKINMNNPTIPYR